MEPIGDTCLTDQIRTWSALMTFTLVSNPGETPEIDVDEAIRAPQNAQLVDVREPREWANARIPGSLHIPLGQVAARASELDGTRPVIAICHSGVRSLTATDTLLGLGFSEVASLRGGIVAWYEAGHPIEQ
jgi:rhodanese-related sulfurtransferase